MKTKAQIWSTDVIIATTIFLVAFIAIIMVLSQTQKNQTENVLIEENELISYTLSNELTPFSFFYKNQIDQEKLIDFSETDYTEIKQTLGLKSDFFIHFKDKDGNVINVNGIKVMGSPEGKITLEGTEYYCNGTEI